MSVDLSTLPKDNSETIFKGIVTLVGLYGSGKFLLSSGYWFLGLVVLAVTIAAGYQFFTSF